MNAGMALLLRELDINVELPKKTDDMRLFLGQALLLITVARSYVPYL